MKLWNSYAFFCNYARLDGFDPESAGVPVGERPDIDRWILSDLQLLIRTARREFCTDACKFREYNCQRLRPSMLGQGSQRQLIQETDRSHS